MTKQKIEKTILEIEAKASTCDYIAGCAVIERMKMLERTDPVGNIDELSRIWEHVSEYCNDKKYPQCGHLKYEMLKSHDIMV